MFDVHDAVHDAFMTLPPYASIREGEVHELGLGVRKGSRRARSDPLSEPSERIERECPATSAEGQLVAHPVGLSSCPGGSCFTKPRMRLRSRSVKRGLRPDPGLIPKPAIPSALNRAR